MQVFRIEMDGTTTELTTDGAIKDLLETDQSYVIVNDAIRKVFLWKGVNSSVRSKFIGAKRSQEIRGQVGMHYGCSAIDETDEPDDFLNIIGGKTSAGIAKAIQDEQEVVAKVAARTAPKGGPTSPTVHPLRDKNPFGAPKPAAGMNIAGSQGRTAQNTGPLYTGKESMTNLMGSSGGGRSAVMPDESQVDFGAIMEKLEQIKMPSGYEREMIIIGNQAYSVVEKVQKFLGKTQTEKVIEKVGTVPEGVFFASGYTPRLLSENGKVLAIEFLKRMEGGALAEPVDPETKGKILRDQLKIQLPSKK